uniref:NADH-ubiquinone oxidoreductase chain 5 n=1 Tax=Donacia distincta TaxID=131636 RepID=U3L000_9CUCU|nr:NADH dehydrogenase subunit 5 [Donacia distincta]
MNFYLWLFFIFMMCSLLMFFSALNFMILDYSLIIELNLFSLSFVSFVMILLLDWISLLFMSFVLFISSLVIFYSKGYMEGEVYLNRFIILVVLFVFTMMFMIISPNLLSILLGWDGLGLISYCLVIYYQNMKSFNAGMLTVLSNRIGDVMLLMSIAWMLNFGSWNFMFYIEIMKNDNIMSLISYMVVLAAFTKSAQIPFSSWLPAAMAAPTPVSALVHSSTLVTAGVYLLIRFNISFSFNLMYFFLFLSSITMFMSGLAANLEFDLKKIIALSTLSQLGLMMSILFLGDYYLSFFHLLIHALFKALLFLCAGMMIHNLNNCQDIRYMGNLVSYMPLTCVYFNICNFSLCGLPFLSGFYSKDLIVEVMSMMYLNTFIYMIFYISIGLTVSYSIRLMYYSLINNYNYLSLVNIKECHFMLSGMSGLIIFVVIMGSIMNWLMFIKPVFICLSVLMKLMTLLMIIIGAWIGKEISKFKISYWLKSKNMHFYAMMWNLPMISTLGVNFYPIHMGYLYYKFIDLGWLEYYGAYNLSVKIKSYIKMFTIIIIKSFKNFFLMMIIWLMFLLLNII